MFNTIGPDRAQTMEEILGHLGGCRFFGAGGAELPAADVRARLTELRLPVREKYAGGEGWRLADLREDPGDYTMLFVELEAQVLARYGRRLLAGERGLQRRTKYGDLSDAQLAAALDAGEAGQATPAGPGPAVEAGQATPAGPEARPGPAPAPAAFLDDVREEYLTVLAHLIDSRC